MTADRLLYLGEQDLLGLGKPWANTIDAVEAAVRCLDAGDYAQPIKPFLRYRAPENRIIAMPGFLGGGFEVAGIKWVASFPGNPGRGLPRAHSVVILNDPGTGAPVAIINTALLSVIRTASVSGLFLRHFDRARRLERARVGIIGWGPIGRHHLEMCEQQFGARIAEYRLFDLRGVDRSGLSGALGDRVRVVSSWQDAYRDADVFITCTVAAAPYVDLEPKAGSLQLNVSLRDYTASVYEHVRGGIVVDDWSEVCREATDIETFHLQCGLEEGDVRTLVDVVVHGYLAELRPELTVMFNPMGMAVFDLAVASYYVEKARAAGAGRLL
jgi:ornithine cyclodeaminase